MDVQEEWLIDLRTWAEKNDSIQELWLYGSRAEGPGGPERDVDLAVILSPKTGNTDWALGNYTALGDAWQRELSAIVERDVSLEALLPGEDLYLEVLQTGHLLWVRPKQALPSYPDLVAKIRTALGPNRRPLLIGVDGARGSGKTATASWLEWQLEMPAINLDLYTDDGTRALNTHAGEVRRLIERRIVLERRPVIVEGVLLLEAIEAVGRKVDFLIFLDGKEEGLLVERIESYWSRYQPRNRADFVLTRRERKTRRVQRHSGHE